MSGRISGCNLYEVWSWSNSKGSCHVFTEWVRNVLSGDDERFQHFFFPVRGNQADLKCNVSTRAVRIG